MLAALRGQTPGIHEHLELRLPHQFLADRIFGIHTADHAVAPLEYLVAILEWNAQQLGDDLERKFSRDIGHEVASALLERALDNGDRDFADVRRERVDHARGEPAVDERAVSRVVRRVHRKHHAAAALEIVHRRIVLEGHDATARLLGGVRCSIAVDFDDVVVARDYPESRAVVTLGMTVNRRMLAQVGEPFVRYAGDEAIEIEQIDLAEFHGAHLLRIESVPA